MTLLSYADWKEGVRPADLQVEVKETHTELLPINEATEDELLAIKGVGPKTVEKLLSLRPFSTEDDLKSSGLAKSAVAALLSHFGG